MEPYTLHEAQNSYNDTIMKQSVGWRSNSRSPVRRELLSIKKQLDAKYKISKDQSEEKVKISRNQQQATCSKSKGQSEQKVKTIRNQEQAACSKSMDQSEQKAKTIKNQQQAACNKLNDQLEQKLKTIKKQWKEKSKEFNRHLQQEVNLAEVLTMPSLSLRNRKKDACPEEKQGSSEQQILAVRSGNVLVSRFLKCICSLIKGNIGW